MPRTRLGVYFVRVVGEIVHESPTFDSSPHLQAVGMDGSMGSGIEVRYFPLIWLRRSVCVYMSVQKA